MCFHGRPGNFFTSRLIGTFLIIYFVAVVAFLAFLDSAEVGQPGLHIRLPSNDLAARSKPTTNVQMWSASTHEDARRIRANKADKQIRKRTKRKKVHGKLLLRSEPSLPRFYPARPDSEQSGSFEILGDEVFVYSAYLDDRKSPSFIRTLILMSEAKMNTPIYCHFPELVPATLYELCENHAMHYGGYIFSCRVPLVVNTTAQLNYLTISLELTGRQVVLPILKIRPPAHKLAYLDKYPQSSNATGLAALGGDSIQSLSGVKEEDSGSSESFPASTSFAVCISPLFGNVSASQLIEFIELSRILGATFFIFYNNSMTNTDTNIVLEYYSRRNLVLVLPWALPTKSLQEVWYQGQLLAHNDCLYRSMAYFDVVAFNDIDEFIVPRSGSGTWREAFTSLLTDGRCGLSFQSAIFGGAQPEGDALKTLAAQNRTLETSPVLTKVMLIPWRVFEVGIHHISKQNREEWLPLKVQPSQALLHHYRPCAPLYDIFCFRWVKDTTMADRYQAELTLSYQQVLRNISTFRKAWVQQQTLLNFDLLHSR